MQLVVRDYVFSYNKLNTCRGVATPTGSMLIRQHSMADEYIEIRKTTNIDSIITRAVINASYSRLILLA